MRDEARYADFADLVGRGRAPAAAFIAAVRAAFAAWSGESSARGEHVVFVTPSIALRVLPLEGDPLICVVLFERYSEREELADAMRLYHISRREAEVIELLLSGDAAAAIGEKLGISEMTVHGHVRKILEKTSSKTRTEMAAKVLGWRSRSKGRAERDD